MPPSTIITNPITQRNVFWKILINDTLKHMNLVDNAPVGKEVFNNVEYLGVTELNKMTFLFDPSEWKTVKWGLRQCKVELSENGFLIKMKIRQHLRRGRSNSFHFETWLFLLVKNADDIYFMCPLKKDSDYNYDIFQVITETCKVDSQYPWARHSCI